MQKVDGKCAQRLEETNETITTSTNIYSMLVCTAYYVSILWRYLAFQRGDSGWGVGETREC